MKRPATLFAAFCLAACSGEKSAPDAPVAEAAAPPVEAASDTVSAEDRLAAAIEGAHRSDEERARDVYRHPQETLEFFGVEPSMSVVEIWPGGGWYTNVIAPYLAGDGVYYAAQFDPEARPQAAAAIEAFKEKYGADADLYGTVEVTVLGVAPDQKIAPDATADAVLTFRNVHNWMRGDEPPAATYFQKFYDALKPGGVLGVVEHRADSVEVDPSSGYVAEETVIEFAEAAGFVLDARSEINANPLDTKDHPFGVWTLPPVRRSSAARGMEDPEFDRTKYDAIGESDRMSLRFVKPATSEDASE